MFGFSRVTPWVGRLIIANAVMLLLMQTVLTSPAVVHALAFAPAGGRGLQQPWTVLTYMFVHADLLHLAANMLGLYVFGTAVEQRLGSRSFIWFYLYCGIGAALFTLLLSPIREISPFIGASGAVMGVTVAYALLWPDAEILVFPFPMPVSARTLAIGLVVFNVAMAFVFHGGMIAYEAHVGGALMGYLFFRAQAIARRAPREPMRPIERVVMAGDRKSVV